MSSVSTAGLERLLGLTPRDEWDNSGYRPESF